MTNSVYAAAASMFAACGPCIFETRRAKHRRLAWKFRHDERRPRRRQPHPNRLKRLARQLAERLRRDFVPPTEQEMEAILDRLRLHATVLFVGRELGLPREPGESTDAHRARLLATGKVRDIQPGRAVMAGKVDFVTCTIGFAAGASDG